ncbi:hypothetical protein AB6A40_007419 [Gnathostoma spinigerum]|uniref:BTB domain-containing protein n=1 Tax=Gnathostoma spinigerum TaxID=75299 RepID=A0ABD6EMD8_9BILA
MFHESHTLSNVINDEPTELSFMFTWKIPIVQRLTAFNVFGDSETFRTTYKSGSYEWILHIYRSNLGFPEPRVQIYVEQGRVLPPNPHPMQCRMSFKLLDSPLRLNAKYSRASALAYRTSSHIGVHTSYRIPSSSNFSEKLSTCFTSADNVGKTVLLTVNLLFSAETFLPKFSESLSIAQSPPLNVDMDFRWQPLHSEYCDFTLHCLDGDLHTSKSALFLSSPFFRSLFMANEDGLKLKEMNFQRFRKKATQQVLIFLITGTFEVPADINTEYAREIFDIAVQFKPLNMDSLKNLIHRSLCEQLMKKRKIFEEVINILVFAHELSLPTLRQMCMAVIAYEYYRRFKNEYNDETTNPERRAMFERLKHEGFMLSVSPLSKIDAIRRLSLKCQLTFRYGSHPNIPMPLLSEKGSTTSNFFQHWFDAD